MRLAGGAGDDSAAATVVGVDQGEDRGEASLDDPTGEADGGDWRRAAPPTAVDLDQRGTDDRVGERLDPEQVDGLVESVPGCRAVKRNGGIDQPVSKTSRAGRWLPIGGGGLDRWLGPAAGRARGRS